jgi:hypothetical protein
VTLVTFIHSGIATKVVLFHWVELKGSVPRARHIREQSLAALLSFFLSIKHHSKEETKLIQRKFKRFLLSPQFYLKSRYESLYYLC